MTTQLSDAALVAGHLAGDASALGGIYDRYADSLHDTAAAMLNDRSEAADVLHDVMLIAAERLGQLREPDRLKPWLFAILRNEVYRRSKQRRRTIATDFSGASDGYDMADERHDDLGADVADDMAGDQLAELVRGAARGLDERDQLVLELSVRQGLDGQDLADALGVSTNQSYTLVHRMRERVERSLSAYVVAKAGRRDCSDLDKLLGSWDGEFTVLIRKRVARHVDGCEVCDTRRRGVAPLALFAAAPVYAAPATLRDEILGSIALQSAVPPLPYQFTATDGFPQLARMGRRVAAWIPPTAAATLVLVVAGASFVWLNGDGTPDVLRDAGTALNETSTTRVPETPTTIVVPSTTGRANAPRDPLSAATTSTTAPTTVVDEAADSDKPPASEPPPTEPSEPTEPAPRPAVPEPPSPAPDDPATAPPDPPSAPPTASPTDPPPATATTTLAPLPGQLALSGGVIDLGAGSSSGSVTITNVGDLPVVFAVTGDPAPFVLSPLTGTLDGGTSTQLLATLDRSNVREGASSASVQVSGGGASFSVRLVARTERPPTFSNAGASGSCSAAVGISASAGINDESGIANAQLSVSGPLGLSGSTSMSQDGPTWFGFVSIDFPPNSPPSGTWTWTISASDTRGNVGSTSGSVRISC